MVDENNSGKIDGFEKLIAWQTAQDLAVAVHQITRKFPADERFALTDQLKRASASVSANIAEGFGRRTIKDKLHFYTMAYGSLLETKNYVYLAERLSYVYEATKNSLIATITSYQKLLNALMRSLNAKV